MNRDRKRAYERFVERAAPQPAEDGYLFDAPRCRFQPEPSDELVAPPGAQVVPAPGGVAVALPGGASLLLHGFEVEDLRRVFARLPCSYSRVTIELGSLAPRFIEQALAKVLFAPKAVAALETELPALELVRFPGSPYEVVRAYWRNQCAVRRRLHQDSLPESVARLRALLLELHELLLLGPSDAPHDATERSSFYLPQSALGRKRPAPGTFYEAPSEFERRGGDTILTSGARVSVPLLGGVNYWQLLGESVDDPDALADERELEIDGLSLGRVLRARSADESEARPWFLPPRPLSDEHFRVLLASLRDAERAIVERDTKSALAALAAFHYRFVRFHPLPSGNQSLAMSFVNSALRRLLGMGIPHLLLDQMALRFDLPAYQQVFERAARVWSAPWPNAAERLRHLLRMRNELNAFITSLQNAASLLEARALLTDEHHAARLALL